MMTQRVLPRWLAGIGGIGVLALIASGARAQTFTCATNGDGTCRDLIPDANAGTTTPLTSKITVPSGSCAALATVGVNLRVLHDNVGDLRIRLTAPNGTVVTLWDRPGVSTADPAGDRSDDINETIADGGALAGKAGDGLWTLEIVDEAHAGTGALDGWGVSLSCVTEDCANCRDDDFDGDIDRRDADCPPRANGAGAGLGGTDGKSAGKCQVGLHKAGAKLVINRLTKVHRCLDAAQKCLQQAPGNAGCLTKAKSFCQRQLGGLAGDRAKLAAAAGKCSAGVLLPAAGLGFEADAGICAALGVASVASPADVGNCIAALHACRVDALIGVQAPRAAELLSAVAADASQFPCLGTTANGGGAGVGDAARGKVVAKCAAGIGKAARTFATKKMRIFQVCTALLTKCVQKNDAACVQRVGRACSARVGTIAGLEARFTGDVAKRCPDGALADLQASTGLGFSGLAGTCSVDGVGQIASCLADLHECRIDQVIEGEVPRLRELLGLVGVSLPWVTD